MKVRLCGMIGVLSLMLVFACEEGGGGTAAEDDSGNGADTTDAASKQAQSSGQETTSETPSGQRLAVTTDISKRLARFAPVAIDVDDSLITDELRPVLRKLVQAAEIIDELYLLQVSEDNLELRKNLAAQRGQSHALAYFDIMYGPWDRLEHGEPFIGNTKRPAGVTYYPPNLTKEAFQAFIDAHPDQNKALTGYFTVIRQQGDDFVAVPYSEHYSDHLERAGRLLEEAAELTSDERLERYLKTRAQAFQSNDYFESDVAWVQLGDCPIEVVIGPYEVYEDELMGMKAAFEAFITIRDPEASQRLARISELSTDLERALPVEDRHRNFQRGENRPISVVYLVTAAGDTRAGVQTLAFNLPNDERVREAHGYKLVLLRNVMEAKYNMILMPIAQRLVAAEQLGDVSFDAFLNNTLLHETAHGLGPGRITLADGTETDVNRRLSDLYSTIEEAKADVVGLFASQYLIENNELPESLRRQIYATFLAGFFRSVRFGANEAHGRANMIQFNYLLEKGGIEVGQDGKYRINYNRIQAAIRDLSRELLTIEGDGNYDAAREFIERYGSMSDELQRGLNQLGDIPVDIWPSYPAVERLNQSE